MAFAAPYVRWAKIKLVVLVALKTKERIEAVHASSFTQLRAARMRKTLLLLVCVY